MIFPENVAYFKCSFDVVLFFPSNNISKIKVQVRREVLIHVANIDFMYFFFLEKMF
jgi:hypothetical protein